MKRGLFCAGLLALWLLTACGAPETVNVPAPTPVPETESAAVPPPTEETPFMEEKEMKLYINETEIPVTWEDNASVEALRKLAAESVTVPMSMYGGFEQVGSLGQRLPRNDRQTTTRAGDIVLYSGDQIVVFYGSNTWAYTRLGRMDLAADELVELLGHGDVTLMLKEE